jgi:hypothetical protein
MFTRSQGSERFRRVELPHIDNEMRDKGDAHSRQGAMK